MRLNALTTFAITPPINLTNISQDADGVACGTKGTRTYSSASVPTIVH